MHYKDGTPAKLKDVVRGRGYNVKYEIQGVVTHLTPGSDTCNIQVAYLKPVDIYHQGFCYRGSDHPADKPASEVLMTVEIEYGEAKAFELINGEGEPR